MRKHRACNECGETYLANKNGKYCSSKCYERSARRRKQLTAMWISTIDRVPDKNQIVIAVDAVGDMAIAEFKDDVFMAIAFGFDAYVDNGSWASGPDRITGLVTHWMALPGTPKSWPHGVANKPHGDVNGE